MEKYYFVNHTMNANFIFQQVGEITGLLATSMWVKHLFEVINLLKGEILLLHTFRLDAVNNAQK